jgi:hypothetical protein
LDLPTLAEREKVLAVSLTCKKYKVFDFFDRLNSLVIVEGNLSQLHVPRPNMQRLPYEAQRRLALATMVRRAEGHDLAWLDLACVDPECPFKIIWSAQGSKVFQDSKQVSTRNHPCLFLLAVLAIHIVHLRTVHSVMPLIGCGSGYVCVPRFRCFERKI